MSKNVVIFADGTGQAGGISFDEVRTNIYKMYRATRTGPDTAIDPADQVAFYECGLGSAGDGGHLVGRLARAIYNIVSQATGFGITARIIDCYAAVITNWTPGDRIFLFGFSRGAYTARCVAEVIALCGVPTDTAAGPMKRDPASIRRLAAYAVKNIYQFTAPRPAGKASGRQQTLEGIRLRLAQSFRAREMGALAEDPSSFPYFVGVFDTVAALGNPIEFLFFCIPVLLALFAVAGIVAALWGSFLGGVWIVGVGFALAAVSAATAFFYTHIKMNSEAPTWKERLSSLHLTDVYQRTYDDSLDPHIRYAKHAMSLDENRKAFQRVAWGHVGAGHVGRDENHVLFFEQVWFSGNHADVGGGYPEIDSRLSDVTLDWMVRCACEIQDGLKIDKTLMRPWPAPLGPQHDEVAAGFGLLTSVFRLRWPQGYRSVGNRKAIMHPSVYTRFRAAQVRHFDFDRPYRPEALKGHDDFARCYDEIEPASEPACTCDSRLPKAF